MEKNTMAEFTTKRAPIVVIMGHVDHGKSTLLDYIRKTNIVDGEAGGITQHLSAYVVEHKDADGKNRSITFIDTPGHAAFSGMRSRGANVADIAILVVSAEDGFKAQTKEAYETIKDSGIPYIVAINKIDKPGADIEKTKYNLIENEIYLEGMGGNIPFVPISAKIGTGVPDLLETILLVADLENFECDPESLATGLVIESHQDAKRGAQATLIIRDGSVMRGQYIVAGSAYTSTRMLESFLGKNIEEATCSMPIRLAGFTSAPVVGTTFHTVASKKEAEQMVQKYALENSSAINNIAHVAGTKLVPVIIKTDVSGTGEAIAREIQKMTKEGIAFKIISIGVGNISETDIKLASSDKDALIVGFNVKLDSVARDANEQIGVPVEIFNIIYKLTEWLDVKLEERRPRIETQEVVGALKILKTFSQTKEKQVIGGKVTEGRITSNAVVRIMRRENEIGRGKILELQTNKVKTKEIGADTECGLTVESKIEIAPGDILEAYITVTK